MTTFDRHGLASVHVAGEHRSRPLLSRKCVVDPSSVGRLSAPFPRFSFRQVSMRRATASCPSSLRRSVTTPYRPPTRTTSNRQRVSASFGGQERRNGLRHPQALALSIIRGSPAGGTEGREPSLHVDGLYGVVTERRREEGQDAVARRILT